MMDCVIEVIIDFETLEIIIIDDVIEIEVCE